MPWWRDYNRRDELDAISILKKRYANGEISKEEYDKMIKDIKEFYLDKSNAMEILKIRYAKGEINEEQYVKMKKEVQ
jgi:uncharacterized membrane protein